jgi:signal transduction histidine kinase
LRAADRIRAGTQLALRVEDDGVGLPQGWRLEDHGGVGLSNMARRLEELYGANHAFIVAGAPGAGVRVDVAVPLRIEANAAPRHARRATATAVETS